MSQKEEDLDEKIARIRRQNAAIIQRQKMIEEEIQDAKKKNAVVNLKSPVSEESDNGEFGPTLYSDKLSQEKRIVKSSPEDVWDEKLAPRKNFHRSDKEEEWREERKRIDEERIRRQKANSGTWKREWDADKVPLSEERSNRSNSRDPNNTFNRTFRTEKSDNRGNYYSDESKGTSHYDTEISENETQNRWKSDKPIRRNNSERRSNDFHDHREPSNTSDWETNISETDQFNNNPVKPTRSRNTTLSRTLPSESYVSSNDNFGIENWDVQCNEKATSMNVWQPLSGNNARTIETTKPASISEWRAASNDHVRTIETNKPRASEWRISNDNIKLNETIKPKVNEWRAPSTDNVKVTETNKQKENNWRASAGDPRPIAVRGSKWDRPLDTNRSKLTSNLNNRLNRCNKSPDKLKISRNEKVDLDESPTKVTIPKDLKNIVIHVKNSGSNQRKVEVLNDTNTDSKNSSLDDNQKNNRDFEAYENASGYGTMTFERSDLKRCTEHAHYDDLSTQTSIVTQMFSNSKINDDNFSTNSNNKSGSLRQIYESDHKPLQPLNDEQCNPLISKEQRIQNSQEVKFVRTIKEENLVLDKKPKDVKRLKKTIKLSKVKNTQIIEKNESKEIDLGDEDEWEDASDDEWEDVYEEENVV